MADQPDWQRYQSSTGPALYNQFSANPPNLASTFVGPWRSIYITANEASATAIRSLLLTWSADAAATQVMRQETILLGLQQSRTGWKPVIAQYLKIGISTPVPAGDQSLTMIITPSLLDAQLSARYLPTPLINIQGNTINHNNFVTYTPLFFESGPLKLTAQSDAYSLTYDVQTMLSNGTFAREYRFQSTRYNQAEQWDMVLPEKPVQIVVTNTELWGRATYSFRVDPA